MIFRRSKRRDLHGNKVKPRPIFNSIEEGRELWYAYEYMPKEKYPHPNEVDFLTYMVPKAGNTYTRKSGSGTAKSWKLFGSKKGIMEDSGT